MCGWAGAEGGGGGGLAVEEEEGVEGVEEERVL